MSTDAPQFLSPDSFLKDLHIEEGMRIAEFGAGRGYIIFKVGELVGQKGCVYALDIQKSVISHLKDEITHRGTQNITPTWTNIELLGHNPVKNNELDMVLVVNMLFQSSKYKNIMEEAKRELKPGGEIVIIDWKKQSAPFGPPLEHRVDLEKLKRIAYSLELNKIREFEPGQYHFGIVFRK